MYEIAPGPVFSGPGWTVIVADGDPLEQVLAIDDPLVVLDPSAGADAVAEAAQRLLGAGRRVAVVLPERLIDRAVALAEQLTVTASPLVGVEGAGGRLIEQPA